MTFPWALALFSCTFSALRTMADTDCYGSPIECGVLSPGICLNVKGCSIRYDETGYPVGCMGSSFPCEIIVVALQCLLQKGCAWKGPVPTTAPPPAWTGKCTGQPGSCVHVGARLTGASDEESCLHTGNSAITGCEWRPQTDPYSMFILGTCSGTARPCSVFDGDRVSCHDMGCTPELENAGNGYQTSPPGPKCTGQPESCVRLGSRWIGTADECLHPQAYSADEATGCEWQPQTDSYSVSIVGTCSGTARPCSDFDGNIENCQAMGCTPAGESPETNPPDQNNFPIDFSHSVSHVGGSMAIGFVLVFLALSF